MELIRARRRAALMFIAPAVVVLAAVNLFPFIYAVWMSLHRVGLAARAQPKFLGGANFENALSDERFWSATAASLQFVAGAVMIELVLGTALAFAFASRLRGLSTLRSLSILPVMVMPIVTALVWFYMFNPSFGLLNWLVGLVGLAPQEWLTTDGLAMASVVLADVWQWTPFVMLVVFAGLQSLPEYVYEAAKMDGLRGWQIFWRVTLPLLRPTLLVVVLIRLVDSFRTFELVFIMTKGAGGTEILPYYVYLNAFVFRNQAGYAAAMAILMIALITVLAQLVARRLEERA